MSTPEPTTAPSRRPRSLRDDLLADLRQATPMPAARPEATPVPEAGRPAPVLASVPAQPVDAADPGTPTVDVRLTPRSWSAPSLRTRAAGPGVVLAAGPVRISITGFRR
jgi:hypothetical protein